MASRVLKRGNNQITQSYSDHVKKCDEGKAWARGTDVVKEKNSLEYITAHTDGTIIKVVNYLDGTNKVLDEEGMGYGNYVMIQHKDNYVTLYAHLEKVNVKEGETIKKGLTIGFMGNTGNSFGAHLHFEIRKYNVEPKAGLHDVTNFKWLDPEPYLNSDLPITVMSSAIKDRYKVINKDGKQIGAFSVLDNAKRFASANNSIIYDAATNTEIKMEVPKVDLTASSYPNYTGSAYYRIRKSFNDPKSQAGAYSVWKNAFAVWSVYKEKGYHIYDNSGKQLD